MSILVEFDYIEDVNGTIQYPDSVVLFGRTERVGNKVVGEYNGALPLDPYTGRWPPDKPLNVYTLSEFLEAVDDDELGVILEMVNSSTNTNANRKAKRVWHKWQATNKVDFNDSKTVAAVTWLVQNTTEWTGARATELGG